MIALYRFQRAIHVHGNWRGGRKKLTSDKDLFDAIRLMNGGMYRNGFDIRK